MGPRFVTLLFGPLGDALMALALFDDLVQVAPNATLTILTRRNAAMIRELAKNYPGITVLEVPEGVASLRVFAHILSHRSVVLMLGLGSAFSWRYRLLFLLLRLRGSKTVGFWLSGLSVRIPYDISLSMLDNFRRLMPHALPGWEVTEGAPSVQLPQREPKAAPKPGSYIVMHVAGASIAAALPPARWQTLISYINHQYPHLAVVLTGTPTERSKLEALGANLQVVVRTDLSISELVWLIDNAALYVGIDTGVTHIAGVLQQKSIVVRHTRVGCPPTTRMRGCCLTPVNATRRIPRTVYSSKRGSMLIGGVRTIFQMRRLLGRLTSRCLCRRVLSRYFRV
jgi:ADP-heptose:LPS heptosyltransferase